MGGVNGFLKAKHGVGCFFSVIVLAVIIVIISNLYSIPTDYPKWKDA